MKIKSHTRRASPHNPTYEGIGKIKHLLEKEVGKELETHSMCTAKTVNHNRIKNGIASYHNFVIILNGQIKSYSSQDICYLKERSPRT